ncbi:uncharacterized protein [Lolium perenne]|uniref:uncharacterized protein isoform X1 n=1 Tax=Lolium perenne TaxID=4522 RepID=UPI0021F693F1|nr:uncharacterized protein LOC127343034 isoform X1 [Lolium perenne]
MPRVLYCARNCPPLEPPFPLPPASHKEPKSTPSILSTTATQQHFVDLDDPNSPTSPLPDTSNQEQDYYEYETDSDCPPTPEQQDYSDIEDESSHLLNVPEYANTALEHYNSQDEHKIKYRLIKAIVSCKIIYDGFYQHVNFTAKSDLENSKEEFFFAELRLDHDIQAWVPVCIVALQENERVGGFSELVGKGGVDPRHCFGCGDIVKHPLDGSLYEGGHYLVENCFFHKYIEVLPATQLCVQDQVI